MTAAVIPVKRLFEAKGRLAPACSPAERREVCLRLLRHMLAVLSACPRLDLAAVVSPDEALRSLLAREFPAVRFLPEPGDLNRAAMAASRLLAAEGYGSMLFALGDLPLLSADDLDAALDLGRRRSAVLMPDRHGRGTNAMLLSPPDLLPAFHFGPDSFPKHLAQAREAGVEPAVLERPGFGWDVDTPGDLAPLSRGDAG